MSTEMKSVRTERNGEVTMTQFWGGTDSGKCMQLTARSQRTEEDPVNGFDVVQLTKADATQLAFALLEWASDQREEA